MPSANTGKTIQQVTFKKKVITLTFDDASTLQLSERSYSQFYVYAGKTLSAKEVTALEEASLLDPFHAYLQHMFARGRYSEKQIRDKLYQRKALRYQVEALIQEYKGYGLINDAQLIQEWMEYFHEKHMGYHAIAQKLHQKGFEETLIKSSLKPANEDEKIQRHLPSLLKKVRHLPLQEQKQRLYQALLSKGFESALIIETLDSISLEENEQTETHGKKVFLLAKKRYATKHQDRALQQRIIAYMRSKGYTMSKIQQWLGEGENDTN